jgi:hypothetical protein
MSAHTPGPWFFNPDFNEVQAEADGQPVAVLSPREGESEANARLIAAAPDLYEALLSIVNGYEVNAEASELNVEKQEASRYWLEGLGAAAQIAREALAKVQP